MTNCLQLYSVYDQKSKTYGTPFTAQNDAVAKRMFHQLANDDASTIYSYPEDYNLNHIGYINLDTGMIEANQPNMIVTGLSCKKE